MVQIAQIRPSAHAKSDNTALFLGFSWYVAHTKPRAETIAAEHLNRQGYKLYLPQVKRIRPNMESAFEPMFPRYIFFAPATPAQSIAPVQSTVGISNIVRFGNQPATILESTLQEIQQVEAKQHLAEFSELTEFQPGSQVEVVHGALAGMEGLVSGVAEERILVMLKLLGRELKVGITPTSLRLAR